MYPNVRVRCAIRGLFCRTVFCNGKQPHIEVMRCNEEKPVLLLTWQVRLAEYSALFF